MLNNTAPVAIVGAGPVGIALALRLASLGVRSVLMDGKPHQVKQGSKACLIQGDVLEVLDKFGCGEQISQEGVAWRNGHTYIRNREISRMEYPERPGHSEFVNISQFRIEQIMLQKLAREPLCELCWDHKVTAVHASDDGVRLSVETGGKRREKAFRYVVGCDGIRSTIRKALGVRWTGYTHKDRFLITDIRVKLPLKKERHFHFDPHFNRGRQLVMHPQPGDMWRIDWQLPPSADIEQEQASGALDKRIRAVIGNGVDYEIDWLSTYRFNQRVAEHFCVGPVFLAGDAAHALPPYGSRGMNSGIQDADNLAWKMAAVLQGRANGSLLDSYHEERYRAACENLRVTEATIRFMVPPTRLHRLWRDFLLALSERVPAARKLLNSGKMTEPFRYADSPLIPAPEAGPLIGAFAPDIPVSGNHGETRLRRCFGPDFTAAAFCRDAHEATAHWDVWRTLASSHGLHVLALVPQGLEAAELPDGLQAAFYQPSTAQAYEGAADGWILVRPDGHIAAMGALRDRPGATRAFFAASGYARHAPATVFASLPPAPVELPAVSPAQ
ncbi:FAD-dependent monooxygenase [Pseudophaeobacter sp.]|uniref:FAD-dependent monooxygenase n=1 Tax=Pseudophaeobacter sp. TaxID=1971739 RepID=UPI00329A762C